MRPDYRIWQLPNSWHLPFFRRIGSPAVAALLFGMVVVAPVSVADEKQIIGPVADVSTVNVGLGFVARVDTGATSCSLHVDKWEILDGASDMADNVGKTIRFLTSNRRGQSEWVERKIAELAVIKTSEYEERRYKVPMTLHCYGVEKRVLVSLNNRSNMTYAMLLGRNFLDGNFIVDVSQRDRP